MTELATVQPTEQQFVQPNLGAPVTIGITPVQVPGGAGLVALQVHTLYGALVFGLPAKLAIDVGKKITAAGRASLTGLTIVGDVGDAGAE